MSTDKKALQLIPIKSKLSRFSSKRDKEVINELTTKYMAAQHRNEILVQLLAEHGIEIPKEALAEECKDSEEKLPRRLLADAREESLMEMLKEIGKHVHYHPVSIVYQDLGFFTKVTEKDFATVGSTFKRLICGSGPKHRVDIVKNLTGRIQRGKLTLVMGPPGSGKSTFLKAIAGQLNTNNCTLEGSIKYNGSTADSNNFIVQKVVDFVNEADLHSALLTVYETFVFAFKATTGGHHSYGKTINPEDATVLNLGDSIMSKVNDVCTVLGLNGCKDTYVGNAMIRGVSGGQKRRVTLGEMLLLPGEVKVMDAISNGLDAATTFDIIRTIKVFVTFMKATAVVSLLQPSPEVFYQFDDLILISKGQFIYHGPVNKVLEYFEDLGYVCPSHVDVADFLQEVSMPDGVKYLSKASSSDESSGEGKSNFPFAPVGADQLAAAWKKSKYNLQMEEEITNSLAETQPSWHPYHNRKYAASYWFYVKLLMDREVRVLKRDLSFIRTRLMQACIVGLIVGTLFTNLDPSDYQTMNGFLFFSCLQCGLGGLALLPTVFEQKAVFYKHHKAKFFPPSCFAISQSFVLVPLQVVEAFIFSLISYWSVGMSNDNNGGRFFTFVIIIMCFGIAVSQIFRLFACLTPAATVAQPLSGVYLVVMVLFSGYIIPKNGISDGWIWFYWINPLAYALKAVTVNEFLGSKYDDLICANAPTCTQFVRLGDSILESRGNPTDQSEIWYSLIFLIGVYLLCLAFTTAALSNVFTEKPPSPPKHEDEAVEKAIKNAENDHTDGDDNDLQSPIIPFEPVSFAFKNVWYTVQLKDGEELDLLRGVDGCFEPGTVTALMGSSGAGKTTLLDVLAGRKNTGTIKGAISVNGSPKEEKSFRKVMAYVEQFDSLSPNDTAREAIEFSAWLRLPPDTPTESRMAWVESVIDMLELRPLENRLIGSNASGFSFEQRKRLSIGVELAANPSILFLDEPTSGLDSRAAQVVIRSIKRVASSGRSVVCTIHQPSVFIFNSFESLLLLRRGGQTVFYGEIGEGAESLISYFEGIPGVPPCGRQNPATWMLEQIGAGTGASASSVDFHQVYKNSSLCEVNNLRVSKHMTGSRVLESEETEDAQAKEESSLSSFDAQASYWTQFLLLEKRSYSSYWRNPDYNFIRLVISVVIALLFASAYAKYDYSTDVDTISLAAVMYITSLFMGVVGMNTVQSVTFSERPSFYREKQCNMYSPFLYVFSNSLVEIPYILVSSLFFTLPFFFIVGLNDEHTSERFLWYWLFMALLLAALVFAGQFFAVLLPNQAAAGVIAGLFSTVLSLFCGFMVPSEDIPPYWLFLYYVNPLHYALEGLYVTQFYKDDTTITLYNGVETTANAYIHSFFSEWKYEHRWYDVMALLLFISFFRVGTYLCLKHVSHQKN